LAAISCWTAGQAMMLCSISEVIAFKSNESKAVLLPLEMADEQPASAKISPHKQVG